MAGVDDKILSIKFDNKNFEKNVADTIKSLENLRNSLKLTEASQGLNDLHKSVGPIQRALGELQDGLNRITPGGLQDVAQFGADMDFSGATNSLSELKTAAQSVDLSAMAEQVDGVSTKFVAMATIGITALSNLVNKAVDAATRFAKSFVGAPFEGFSEYETQLGSIQTILANTSSKGNTLDQVNAALQQLNEYSDKTIYNFGQMAKNIGTFTAAGVGLDTSVSAIKGIANLAAVSGSTADQASTAMYQLSQALSSGQVRLIDWISVTNAGMGGEVFQKALYETGKAMKTIEDIGPATTFESWAKESGGFRNTLESGWLTSDVLTTTLSTFTQEMDVADLKAKGFTDAQIENFKKMASTATDAATKIKTFSQLVSTVKEAIGTGFSDSFRIIIGDFEQAKALWSRVYDNIAGFVNRTADARNSVLQSWADAGGRTDAIEGWFNIFKALGAIIKPITAAFKAIAPSTQTLGSGLAVLSHWFRVITEHMILGEGPIKTLTAIFKLFFSVLNIGRIVFVEVVKLIAGFIGALLPSKKAFGDANESVLGFVEKLQKMLITKEDIEAFFAGLGRRAQEAVKWIQALADTIAVFFSSKYKSDPVQNSIDRVGTRAEQAVGAWKAVMDFMQDMEVRLGRFLERVGYYTQELRSKIANLWGPPDFEPALDAINTGLFGGLIFLFARFVTRGLKLDFGNILKGMGKALDALASHLKALTQQVKSTIIQKLAISVGILTASMVVLSLIDSAALTKALTAISVGMAGLVGSMILMDKNATVLGSGKTLSLGALLIGLSIALLFLAIAMKKLSSLDPGELAKGLAGVTAGMALIVGAVKLMGGKENKANLLHAGAAILLIAAGLRVLAAAVKAFGSMDWDVFKDGMTRMAIGLGLLVGAINLMPKTGTIQGAIAIGILAVALNMFIATILAYNLIPWQVLVKGTLSAAFALGLIGLAMNTLPPEGKMIAAAASMLVLSAALTIVARVLQRLGEMEAGDLAKGLLALTGILALLAIAVNTFTTAIVGAGAMLVVASAVWILSKSMERLGKIKGGDLAKGLGAFTAIIALLAAALVGLNIVLPTIGALSLAILAVGAGTALFGGGILALATGLALLAKTGPKGASALVKVVKTFGLVIGSLIELADNALEGLLKLIDKHLPGIVKVVGNFLYAMLQEIIRLTPEIAQALVEMLRAGFLLLRTYASEWIETGIFILMEFLRGIRDNIGEITTMVMDIIATFLETIADNLQRIIDAGADIIVNFLLGIANRIDDIIAAGIWVLEQVLVGLAIGALGIGDTVTDIIEAFFKAIGDNSQRIIDGGIAMVNKFIEGLKRLGANSREWVEAGVYVAGQFLDAIANGIVSLTEKVANVVIRFLNKMAEVVREKSPEIRKAGANLAGALLDGMSFGLASKAGGVFGTIGNVVGGVVDKAKEVADVRSPSRVFFEIGEYMIQGLTNALAQDTTAEREAGNLADRTVEEFRKQLAKIKTVADIGEINPVIAPVLDLSAVKRDARDLDSLFGVSALKPDLSLTNARVISAASLERGSDDSSQAPQAPTEVKFEQNNYSPRALTTNDIYRSTKSQIALAKEELGIE